MNHITIKGCYIADLVDVEIYNETTGQVSGALVKVGDLWRWLWARRPAFVYRRGRAYLLARGERHGNDQDSP
jgi:hypothetical protein